MNNEGTKERSRARGVGREGGRVSFKFPVFSFKGQSGEIFLRVDSSWRRRVSRSAGVASRGTWMGWSKKYSTRENGRGI